MQLLTDSIRIGKLLSYPPKAGNSLSDDYSELEPPDPIPNSAVKRLSADGSVGFPHVRVGHRQASIQKPGCLAGLFFARCLFGFGSHAAQI